MKRNFLPLVTLSIVFSSIFCGCKTTSVNQKPQTPVSFKVDSPEEARASASNRSDRIEQTSPVTQPTTSNEGSSMSLCMDAERALDQSAYSQAFRLAIQSYVHEATIDAESIAVYAASMLRQQELEALYQAATTHLERAILGKVLINGALSRRDLAGLEQLSQETSDALMALGKSDEASLIKQVCASANQGTPKIAVLLPLSGSDRKIGRAMLGSILMTQGLYYINYEVASGYPYPVVYFDTGSDVRTIPSLMDSIKDYPLILGPIDIQESVAVSSRLDDRVMIGFSPNGSFVDNSPNAIQISYSLREEAGTLAELLDAVQSRKVVAIGPEGNYFSNSVSELTSATHGRLIIESVSFPQNQTDLRTFAGKAANLNADTVFLPASIEISERIMSFMAQENIWCGDPRHQMSSNFSDGRKFVTCVSTSLWSPVENHPSSSQYRFIQNAIYLDYAETVNNYAYPYFKTTFSMQYNRLPVIHEALPFAVVHILRKITAQDFSSPQTLQSGIIKQMKEYDFYIGKEGERRYSITPGIQQITQDGPKSFEMISK